MTSKPAGMRLAAPGSCSTPALPGRCWTSVGMPSSATRCGSGPSSSSRTRGSKRVAVQPFEHVDEHVLRAAQPAVGRDEKDAHPVPILPRLLQTGAARVDEWVHVRSGTRVMISLLCTITVLGCADSALGARPPGATAPASSTSPSPPTRPSTASRRRRPPARQQWMRDKYWRMRAYSPYFDTRTAWYHPRLVLQGRLRDLSGRDRGSRRTSTCATRRAASSTSGTTAAAAPARSSRVTSAPRPTAPPGSPTPSASYAQGYKGLFVDDVNMEQRISDGNGNLQWPVDPRTGQHDDRAAWRRYMAEFMEQIRRELPGAEIVHNSLWFDGDADPYIQRQHNAADLIEIERGVNDSGLRGGEGSVSLRTLLKLIDRRQAARQGRDPRRLGPDRRRAHVRPRRVLPDLHRARRAGQQPRGHARRLVVGLRHRPRRGARRALRPAHRRHPPRLHGRHGAAEHAGHADAHGHARRRLQGPRRRAAHHRHARRRAPASCWCAWAPWSRAADRHRDGRRPAGPGRPRSPRSRPRHADADADADPDRPGGQDHGQEVSRSPASPASAARSRSPAASTAPAPAPSSSSSSARRAASGRPSRRSPPASPATAPSRPRSRPPRPASHRVQAHFKGTKIATASISSFRTFTALPKGAWPFPA